MRICFLDWTFRELVLISVLRGGNQVLLVQVSVWITVKMWQWRQHPLWVVKIFLVEYDQTCRNRCGVWPGISIIACVRCVVRTRKSFWMTFPPSVALPRAPAPDVRPVLLRAAVDACWRDLTTSLNPWNRMPRRLGITLLCECCGDVVPLIALIPINKSWMRSHLRHLQPETRAWPGGGDGHGRTHGLTGRAVKWEEFRTSHMQLPW